MHKMIRISRTGVVTCLIGFGVLSACAPAQQTVDPGPVEISELMIVPSDTDSRINLANAPHLIMYDADAPQGKLLVFLPGTNGIPERGPKIMFEAAIAQGYRVINLAYNTKEAVARICRGDTLANDSDCTEKMRTQRVFGDQLMTLIPDEPQDAIVTRLTKLLTYLDETDEAGNWGLYLKDGQPNWNIISVTGQSQGGGMAAFIAKRIEVNRVIDFSGGWDYSAPQTIAKWYSNDSVTPLDRYYGTYNSKEPMAQTIDETYRAMGIPDDQIYSLSLDVREGGKAHNDGVRNTEYADMWAEVFGDGKLDSRRVR